MQLRSASSTAMARSEELSIPVIDLAPFFDRESASDDDERRVDAFKQVSSACEEWGFFHAINHGLDSALLERALECSMQFFGLPLEEKLKLTTARSPFGFVNQSGASGVVDRKEHLLFHSPEGPNPALNVWPEKPQAYRSVVEKLMQEAARTSKVLTGIVFESLGLPKNYADNLYTEVGDAFIMPFYPASPADYDQEVVLGAHRDGGILTLLAQLNQVEGLQVLKDNQWVTAKPLKNALVVQIADAVQVWSNGRYKSVMHRVAKGQNDRYSFAYFHIPDVKTRIAPLPEFTVNEAPKYRPFLQGEYLQLRFENRKLNSKNSKEITIEHYAI